MLVKLGFPFANFWSYQHRVKDKLVQQRHVLRFHSQSKKNGAKLWHQIGRKKSLENKKQQKKKNKIICMLCQNGKYAGQIFTQANLILSYNLQSNLTGLNNTEPIHIRTHFYRKHFSSGQLRFKLFFLLLFRKFENIRRHMYCHF